MMQLGANAMSLAKSTRPFSDRFNRRYGPWALVTGASDGIGWAFASCLAAQGINVVLAARREALLNQKALELREKFGIETRVIAVDLATPEAANHVVAQTRDLDIGLIIEAAGYGSLGALVDLDVASELAMVDLNCRSVVLLTHAFARRFKEQGRGGIVLLSSIVAFQGVPLSATYGATKAFVQSFAEALRAELRPHHVDVIASAPGPVTSGFATRAKMTPGKADSPETVARQTLGQLGYHTTVRPGFLSKFLGWSLGLLPRWGRVRVMHLIMRGMTPA